MDKDIKNIFINETMKEHGTGLHVSTMNILSDELITQFDMKKNEMDESFRQNIYKSYFFDPNDEDFNSNFFRCDEFKKTHDGTHILFSGDSVTQGVALSKNQVWSKILYDKINKNNKCSGYFNIGLAGNNNCHMVFDIFKYCKNYGNPDLIFINLTVPARQYTLIEGKNYTKIPNPYLQMLSYQFYFMLEQYCKSNNIKLYAFTWYSQSYFNDIRPPRFLFHDMDDLYKNVYEYSKNNKDDKFAIKAKDGTHPGTAVHKFWADFLYEEYLNDNIRD